MYTKKYLESNGWKLQFKFDQTMEVWKNIKDEYLDEYLIVGNDRKAVFQGSRHKCGLYIMRTTDTKK